MTQRKIVVLGGGRVGSAIVRDLVRVDGLHVTVADVAPEALRELGTLEGVTAVEVDLADPDRVIELVRGADLAVGAVPGFMGFATMEAVIAAGVDMVDISFFGEDPFELDAAARGKGVTVLMDCGIAPGCGNVILGHHTATWEAVESFSCMVGGLPVERRWPWEYRAVFSPIDVIEEYTRPARMVRGGRVVVRPALSEVELVDFPGVGTLEAFNTDGLRTLVTTVDVAEMSEKTLRYPGHAEKMRLLREAGFFDTTPRRVGSAEIRPLDMTASLLFEQWRLGPEEEDLTVMRVEIRGRRGGTPVRARYELLDRYDRETGTTSMARTTGYTCTAAVRAVLDGLYRAPGVSPPERLGAVPGGYAHVMRHLAERGVVFDLSEEDDGS
ncbi:MAG: saccharopine dehydrogenase [Acidobacteria bacterium]|nr:saccharopine dehydrogenase [Acidobacteriota bacterium]